MSEYCDKITSGLARNHRTLNLRWKWLYRFEEIPYLLRSTVNGNNIPSMASAEIYSLSVSKNTREGRLVDCTKLAKRALVIAHAVRVLR